LTIIILAAIIIPLTIPYISLQKNFGFQRAVENIEGISPDLFDYFVSPFVFKYYSPLLQEWVVGPGIFVMILLIISMFSIYKKSVNIKRSLIYFLIGLIAVLFSFGYYMALSPNDHSQPLILIQNKFKNDIIKVGFIN